ncbi:MAG: murein hydrolase activator EnvC family protein [Actinomycetota bacterium]
MLGLATLLTVSALAATLLASAAGAADPLAEIEARITAAQVAADRAAAAYGAAETRAAELEAEVVRTRRAIADLRRESARLRSVVRERALVAYIGRGQQLDGLLGDLDDVMDAGRRAVLLDGANSQSNDALDRLRANREDLAAREDTLRVRIDEQSRTLAALEEQQAALEESLATALREQEALKARLERERRAREYEARLAAAREAARAAEESDGGGDDGGGSGIDTGTVIGGGDWVCPVQGAASFADTWGYPRPGGRTHKGVDMFAVTGTPLVAVLAGTTFLENGGAGGLGVYLQATDGNTYYYAHLDEFVGGARTVAKGEVIGTVGTSGNAYDAPAHLHFEIRIGGPNGERVNPYPTVAANC